MRFCVMLAGLALFLGGCVSTPAARDQAAKAVVIARVGEETRISGPLTVAGVAELTMLSAADAANVRALAADGARVFSILVPDTRTPHYAADGSLVELIKVGQVLVVRDGRIVAEFEAID